MPTSLPFPSTSPPSSRPPCRAQVLLACPSAELAVAARAGDGDAAGELFRRTARRARQAARAFCADGDADDAVAEGLTRALGRIDQLREPAAVEAWMIRSAVRAAIDLARQQRRLCPTADMDTLSERCLPAAESAAEVALTRGDTTSMAAALVDVPADLRRLLYLRYARGLAVVDVARMTGRPPGTVRRQCVQARHAAGERFLRRHLRPAAGTCGRVSVLLCQEAYRRPSPRARQVARRHLDTCAGCRGRQAELTALLTELGYRRRSPGG